METHDIAHVLIIHTTLAAGPPALACFPVANVQPGRILTHVLIQYQLQTH